MTENPLVSIIIPSYNQGKFIEKAILSVLNQTYSNIELIIVDGASTDNTVSILKKYNDYINWISESDRGEAHAINKGMRMANGEIFNFPCSDEALLPKAIEIAVRVLIENPDAGIVFGDQNIVDESYRFLSCKKLNTVSLNTLLNISPDIVSQPTAFIRRFVFDTVGPWDDNLEYANDLDLWIRILSEFEGIHIPQALGNSVRHKDEKGMKGIHKALLESFKVRRKYGGKILSKANFRMIKAEAMWLLGRH